MSKFWAAGLVTAAVTVIAIFALRPRPIQDKWQSLPKGGAIRVYAISHGSKHRDQSPPVPLAKRIDRLKSAHSVGQFRQILVPKKQKRHWGGPDAAPYLIVWFEVKDREGAEWIARDGELVLPDGQILRSDSHTTVLAFKPVPYRTPSLRFSAVFDDKRLEFETRNPAYRSDLPVWQPQPLPQTRQERDVALTLSALRAEWIEDITEPARSLHPGQLGEWRALPTWIIMKGGEKVSIGSPTHDWFDRRTEYVDAGGNRSKGCGLLSEPAWKVRCVLTPKESFPFTDSDVRWLGRVDPATPQLQNAPGYALLPLDREARADGVKLAGVFTAGGFELTDNGVRPVAPAQSVAKYSPYFGVRSDYSVPSRSVTLTMLNPSFVVAISMEKSLTAIVLCDEKGNFIRSRVTSLPETPFGKLWVYPMPTTTVRFGLGRVPPFEFEFLVRPPEMTGPKRKPRVDVGNAFFQISEVNKGIHPYLYSPSVLPWAEQSPSHRLELPGR